MPDDPVFLITGASSGIGAATAHAAVEAGYRVALAARALEPRIRRDHHEDQQLYDRLRAAAES